MLAKRNRITSGADFRRIVRRGRRARGRVLLGYALPRDDGQAFRIGIIVAKNVGGAVVRNQVRRRIRAAAWPLTAASPGVDIVVRALPDARSADWNTIEHDVQHLLQRLAPADASVAG